MNPFKDKFSDFFGKKSDGKGSIDSISKILNAKTKITKYGIIGGIAFFFVAIIAILGVISYLLGFVQKNVERVDNLLRGSCILCTNEDLAKIKENQFNTKIRIIKTVGGSKINAPVLASTVLFQGEYNDIMDSLYDENFDEKSFTNAVSDFFASLGVTGNGAYDGISQEQIDLLDAATLIMVNSNVDGKYNEESYKKALVSPGFGTDNWLVNGSTCVVEGIFSVAQGIVHTIPFFSEITGSGNTFDAANRFVNTASVCGSGFIEGTFNGISKIKDSATRQRKKEEIAQNIIDFAKFYEELFGEDDQCLYGGNVASGDMVNWRQCGQSWSNLSVGGGRSVCQIGCTTTSMAFLIAKSGTKLTVSSMDPGVYVTKGAYVGEALAWNFSPLAPNFKTVGGLQNINPSNYVQRVAEALNTPNNGHQQYVILLYEAGSSTHWVAADHVENGKLYVLDPAAPAGTGLIEMQPYSSGRPVTGMRVFVAEDVPFGGSSSSGNSSTNSSTVDVTSENYKRRLENSKKYYQCSSEIGDTTIVKDSKMCGSGCIIASLMGIRYMYTGEDINVDNFISDIVKEGEWIYPDGGVTYPYFTSDDKSPLLTQNWGLSAHPIEATLESIKSSLKSGKKVLFNITSNNGVYATKYGHFIMFDHVDPNTGQIYVWDPAGIANRNGYKTDEEIKSQLLSVKSSSGPWEVSSTNVKSDDMCETSTGVGEITIPAEFGNGGYTVTVYDDWNWVYNQGKMYRKWASAGGIFDDGIATYEGRYLIACTTTFGNIGDKVDFFLEDGTKIPAIIADIKSPNDPGCNKWGHNNGQNVIEFEVSHLAYYNIYKTNPGTSKWYPQWAGKRVASATNLGENVIN